jgi:calcium-translocating P-type ATPase
MIKSKERAIEKNIGLSSAEAVRSREENGENVLSKSKPKSFLRHFFNNLGDPVTRILLCALVVNLFFVFRGGDVIETVGIGVSVFLAAFISTVSERGSEAAFRRLSENAEASSFRVRRDGNICEIPISEIVVGDVVLIGAGEQIPADAFVISGELSVDQSAMTGENREVKKRKSRDTTKKPDSQSAVFRGSVVLAGQGEICVFGVGDSTFLGQISREVQTDTRESPLKLRLTKLAKQISILGYVAATLVAVAYLFNVFVIDSGFHMQLVMMKISDTPYLLEKLLHAFMLALTIIVVAVPEGLPMMIAVVLSANIHRMVKDQVLVRKPVGIEAAGSMNLLFTDKTGTLTEGKMNVCRILTANCSEYTGAKELCKSSKRIGELYSLSCIYNNESDISNQGAIGGHATDRALLVSANGMENGAAYRVSDRLLFDSEKKLSAVLLEGKGRLCLVKGAPERLLPRVAYAYREDGAIASFSPYSYEFSRRIFSMTERGERVLLLCEGERFSKDRDFGALTLICAVSLSDPLREEAHGAVKELKGAGIGIVMITGDNRTTAESIGRSCGIVDRERDIIITSEEMARMSDAELSSALPRLAVVARALPTDKSRLVRIAQERELVVGMTGDGINDAPALKRADIGFAMGSGTQVARDAGDIIILDNNLSSIAKAVLYGRTIFKSIRKFITLQLTMNFCAVGVSMICPLIGIDAPVTVVQMLWINIIMDTLGGLAFAGEAPLPSYMKEKPKRRDEPILNRYMVNQIVVLGAFTITLCLGFLLSPFFTSHFRSAADRIYLLTAFFALFIFTSVFNCFNARTDRLRLLSGIGKNRGFVLIMLAVLCVQIAFVYLGGSVLRTAPLTARELMFTMLVSLSVFPAELLRKLLWKLGKRRNDTF